MFTNNINFKNFTLNKNNKKVKKDLEFILKEKNEIIKSLGPNYKNNYNRKSILKFKNYLNLRVIGMGGSTLGTEAIYKFLKNKIKKNFLFYNNLQSKVKSSDKKKKIC